MLKKILAPAIVGALCLAGVALAQDVQNFMRPGGGEWDVGALLNVNNGGVLNVKTGGKLEFNGVDQTAKLAATVSNPVAAPSSGVRIASGTCALSSGTCTFASGLTAVTACSAIIQESSAPGLNTTTLTETLSGATVSVFGWEPTSSANPTLIATTHTETVQVVCQGT